MDRLNTLLKTCLEGYTGRALNGYSYLTSSADDRKHSIISVGQLPDKRIIDASLIVHVIGDRIVIERDVNDRPLGFIRPSTFMDRCLLRGFYTVVFLNNLAF